MATSQVWSGRYKVQGRPTAPGARPITVQQYQYVVSDFSRDWAAVRPVTVGLLSICTPVLQPKCSWHCPVDVNIILAQEMSQEYEFDRGDQCR